MTKPMPICSKCGLSHWHFQPCSEGKTYKQMGYDSIVKSTGYGRDNYAGRFKRSTEYARVQRRQDPKRLTYQENDPPEAA
jgi:hypothetical protein